MYRPIRGQKAKEASELVLIQPRQPNEARTKFPTTAWRRRMFMSRWGQRDPRPRSGLALFIAETILPTRPHGQATSRRRARRVRPSTILICDVCIPSCLHSFPNHCGRPVNHSPSMTYYPYYAKLWKGCGVKTLLTV